MKTFTNYLNESVDPNKMTEEEQIEYVQNFWINIKNIHNPSKKVQLAAIKAQPLAIKYINNASEEIKNEAIKIDPRAIQYIKNPSIELQLAAIKNYSHAIKYIDNPSEEIKLAAANINGTSILLINNPSETVKQMAVNNIDFNQLQQYPLDWSIKIQKKIKDYITKEIYYKVPKDFPWIPEIKEKFKDIDRFKRFNL